MLLGFSFLFSLFCSCSETTRKKRSKNAREINALGFVFSFVSVLKSLILLRSECVTLLFNLSFFLSSDCRHNDIVLLPLILYHLTPLSAVCRYAALRRFLSFWFSSCSSSSKCHFTLSVASSFFFFFLFLVFFKNKKKNRRTCMPASMPLTWLTCLVRLFFSTNDVASMMAWLMCVSSGCSPACREKENQKNKREGTIAALMLLSFSCCGSLLLHHRRYSRSFVSSRHFFFSFLLVFTGC